MADTNARQQEIIRPPEAAPSPGPQEQKRERIAKVMTGASTTEALVGAGAVVLTILGLIGIFPTYMAAVASIAVGAALLSEGAGITAQYSELMSRMNGSRYETAQVGGGMTTQMLGGLAGISLGILALVGIAPEVLLPVAAIVFGGTILLGSTAPLQVESAVDRGPMESASQHRAHEAVQAAEGSRMLVGLGSAVLGILVLAGVGAAGTLTLVALLGIGAAELLGGSALGARMGMVLRSAR